MSYISVSNTFVNNTANDAGPVNTNFSEIIAGLSDGTKDISVGTIKGNLSTNLLSSLLPTDVTYTLGSVTNRFTTLSLGTNLAKTAAPVANTLYPTNVAKAWGYLTLGAAGAVTVTDGFNVNTATWSTSTLTINFHTNLADGNYIVINVLQGITNSTAVQARSGTQAVGSFILTLKNSYETGASDRNWTSGDTVYFVVFGRQ